MSLPNGIPAPVFRVPSHINPRFAFSSLGGRYVLLAFLPGPGPERDAALTLVADRGDLFRDDHILFFGVLADAASYDQAPQTRPFRWFGDFDGLVRRKYSAVDADGGVQPQWVLVDPSQRILASAPLQYGREIMAVVAQLPAPDDHAGVPLHAPVLIVPRVFDPTLCRRLMDVYARHGGRPSGVMRQFGDKTVGVLDHSKKRRDAPVVDEQLRAEINAQIVARLMPEVEKAFQFKATVIERYIVACYDAETGGYFRPHRDNTTAGTAHRKFAVSINLNAEAFEGGDLRFPEFGTRTYRPPTGGAVVFSCSLLHEATAVTRGQRFAFLPFLYDEAGAKLREANQHLLINPPGGVDPAAEIDAPAGP